MAMTPNALRRHLKELEAEGIVRFEREPRGVGRPANAYRLTAAGEALFPRAYDAALAQVLELVRAQQGSAGVAELFAQQWAEITAEAKDALGSLPLHERVQLLAELLSSRGYMAEAESGPDGATRIREHNCAIRAIAERFPEVCAAEARFLEEVLGATVERHAHIASGANCCEYCVAAKAATPGHDA
jgi:DeoR family suf operon transcriptional repressor